jgi:hypothetical protein
MLPLAVLLFHNHVERSEARVRNAGEGVIDQSAALASSLGQVVSGAKYMLMTLSSAPVIQSGDKTRCRQYAASLREQFPQTMAVGAADLSGNVYCNSLPRPSPVNIADRVYFRSALAQGGLSLAKSYRDEPRANAALHSPTRSSARTASKRACCSSQSA